VSSAASVPPDWPRDYPIEQEYSLELPLGYAPEPFGAPPRIAVMLHAYHIDLLAEFRAYLSQIPFPADLFISTDTEAKCEAVSSRFADWPKGKVEIRQLRNRGRDVAPKLIGFGAEHASYDFVLHLHTKRSNHESGLAGWRGYLLEALLGSPETVLGIMEAFRQVPALGILAPQQIDMLRPWIRWGDNYALAAGLAARMGFPLPVAAPLDFPAGSMFWARPAALQPLLALGLGFEDFPEEAGQTDGTLAHAIERLYFLACEHAGFDWMKIAPAGLLHDARGVTALRNPLALRRFISRSRVRLQDVREQRRDHGEHAQITTLPARPRRPFPVYWRAALGIGRAAIGHVAILTPDAMADGLLSTDIGAGFANSDIVLFLRQPGLLHPWAGEAILQMSAAQNGKALIELAVTPELNPPTIGPDFSLATACGPALAVPREIFAALGGLAELGEAAFRDYGARALAAGFAVKYCPRAWFFPSAAWPDPEPAP
jgi:hypothetical protein